MGETSDLQLGTVVGSRYRVLERLGEGGMGSVYRVEHVHTGQPLALKVLNPKLVENAVALERFRREARAPARINSDHVVKVTDADVAPELGGAPYLVMELLEGETFEQLLRRRGAVPAAEAIVYLKQIARALDKAHGLGIVHRDIKPENLFLTRRDDGSPSVKLLDFGIAKLGGGETPHSKTATGEIFGTPLYMSPEQTLGKTDEISPRTDVWALGLIAHKLLIGREPWTAQTLPHLVAQIAYEPLPVPSEQGAPFGASYDAWFARCCAKKPADRFESASRAVAALAEALGVPENVLSSHPSQPAIGSTSDPGDAGSAFAETAHASGDQLVPARSISDTLAAQVAPKKRSQPLVYVAAGGALLIAAAAGWLVVRASGATVAAQPPPAPDPIVAPPSADPANLAPPVESASEPEPPEPPEPEAEPAPKPSAEPKAALTLRPRPKPQPKVTPAPAPSPSPTPTPTPKPEPKKDPLSGRH